MQTFLTRDRMPAEAEQVEFVYRDGKFTRADGATVARLVQLYGHPEIPYRLVEETARPSSEDSL